MHVDIFDPTFWGNSAWQGIGVLVALVTWILGPLLTAVLGRLVEKPDAQQKHINAYKALAVREGAMDAGEVFTFLPIQLLVAYGFSILLRRVLFVNQFDPTSSFELSILIILVVSWGLSIAKRKVLATLLIWQFFVAMLLFYLLLTGHGHEGAIPITKDFTFLKHFIGQYLPSDVKNAPIISNLRNLPLNAITVDLNIAHPEATKTLFIFVYAGTMLPFVIGYTFYKRHFALQATAFAHLSERRKQEKLDELTYQERVTALAVQEIEKVEKEEALDYKRQQTSLLQERDQIALEKERLALVSIRLDVEKKRAEYMLELTKQLVDTLHVEVNTPELRVELIRNTLPALKDFGQRESTALVFEHLQHIDRETPAAIPTITIDPIG